MSVLRVSTSGAASAVTWTVSVSAPTAHLRVDVKRASEQDADVRPFHPRETCELERDVVAPGIQIRRDVLAVGVGDVDPGFAGLRIRDGDRDAGHCGALLIRDPALKSAKALLRRRQARHDQRHRNKSSTYACVHLSLLEKRV